MDDRMQQQVEEWGFCKHQVGGLAEEVKVLGANVIEQEWVVVDKGLWGPQLAVERMDEMLQEWLL